MAYTEIDYGTQTPQTIDRFGTEQEYHVWAVNGKDRRNHYVVPVVSLWNRVQAAQVNAKAAREKRRFWWSSNRYTQTRQYSVALGGDGTVELGGDRRVDITHSADGRVSIRLDGKFVYRETNRMRKDQRERVVQEYQSQEWVQRELDEETRVERLRAHLERRPKNSHPTEE